MPFQRIRATAEQFRASESGRRFVDAHERHRIDNRVVRILAIVVGFCIAVGGVATFWLPGPQVVIVLVGVGLMASQWRVVARLLDRIEVAGRRWNDEVWVPYPHKRIAKVLLMAAFGLVVAALVWVAVWQGLVPGWIPHRAYDWIPTP